MAPLVTVRLLGLLDVSGPGGTLRLPGPRQRAIVAMLALRAPGVVSRTQLVDGLWGPKPPPTAVKTLHSHIARIRRALAAIGLAELLVTKEPGYALALPPGSLDLAAFGERVDAGRRASKAGDMAAAAGELHAALALRRGDPLADCPVDDWGQAEVARLHETMAGAAEMLAEAQLALGEHGAVAGELERLVASHPLRERLWELLVIAHHRAGHPAEALAAYRRAHAVLIDDLGVEPGRRLRELETALLAGDAELDLPTVPRTATLPDRQPAALAPVRSSLVGRQRELSEVLAALDAGALVTLTGPGGCGKTRLALAALERLAGTRAVAVVDLTPVRGPELLADAVATALDVPEVPGARRADTLVDALAGRDLVVVLDNCEHLVRQGLPELVERLRTRCATVTFLATSREALGVAGESVHLVPPLSTYDSVRLFLDRAAEHGRPVLEDDAGPVATLCAALDGLPLAIELAAARTPVLTPTQIVRRLHDRFGLLDFGTRAAFPPHHRALGTALAWSYDLLSADEAALFTRLGVFVGGFCVDGAEAVWQADGTLDALTGLVAKSLLRVGRAGASTRFFVLETIAAYAAERLAADPVAEAVTRQRHAAFFRDRAEEAALDPTGAGFAELRVEHENLRVAMSFFAGAEDRAGELRMAAALSGYYRRHGHYREGRQRLERAVARSGEVPADLRGNALTAAASLALSECDYDRADRHAADALASAVAAGDQGLAGRSLVLLGAVAMQRAEYAAALDHYGGAVAAFCAPAESRAGPRARGEAASSAHPGAVARYRRERAEARRLLEQALATFGELDLTEHVARTLGLLGLVEHGDGNHGEAARLLARADALRAVTGRVNPG